MKRILLLLQFLPLSIFLGIARSYGFANEAWSFAFQLGAAGALLETIVLLPLLGNGMSRLIAGANFFLIVGGVGFFFNIPILIYLAGSLREAGVFISLAFVCVLGILITPTGVFEKILSKTRAEKKYSILFLIGIVVAACWSIYFRGNPMLAGATPFISLILLKQLFQRKLQSI